jgi:radical SAM superfamily enzyme YgiQ (UPF0313 family)
MKIVLISPPLYLPIEPYLAVPSLKAFLKQGGHDVVQKDLNIEFFDRILSQDCLCQHLRVISSRLSLLSKKKLCSPEERKKREFLKSSISSADYVIRNIEKAKKIMRINRPQRGRLDSLARNLSKLWAFSVINSSLDIMNLRYSPTALCLWRLDMRYSIYSTPDILKALEDEEENPFIEFYDKTAVPEILNEHPDIVGISINDWQQVIPGLTLARIMKSKNIHVVIGGMIFSEEIKISDELFRVCDTFVLYEGEEALAELADRLGAKESLSGVPNLVWRDSVNDKVVYNSRRHRNGLDSLPTPDFTDLPLDLYFSSFTRYRRLPLLVSQGCYWNKCFFCDVGFGYPYRFRKAAHVYADIVKTKNNHNIRSFFLVGDSLDPGILEEISGLLIENNVGIEWEGLARFEPSFTENFCKILRKSGCRKLYLGLESGSQRILDSVNKGTDLVSITKIMQNLRKAGIAVHLYVLMGFWGETKEDAQKTIDFLIGCKSMIDSPDFSLSLQPVECSSRSVMFRDAKLHEIVGLKSQQDRGDLNDASQKYPCFAHDGLSPEEVNATIYALLDLLERKFYYYGLKRIIYKGNVTYNFFSRYILLLIRLLWHEIIFSKSVFSDLFSGSI